MLRLVANKGITAMIKVLRLSCLALATVALAWVPSMSTAALSQPDVVSVNPVDYTPQLVRADNEPKPRVDAMAQRGSTLYAGGLFSRAESADGRQTYPRRNLMAFNATTGAMSSGFAPNVDGNVFAVEATADAVYIGGSFASVDGTSRPAIAKLDPVTGALDTRFAPPFKGGRINEIKLVNGRLIVGGTPGRKLMALDPATGRNTGYINLPIRDKIPNAWGGVAVYQFAVNPAGTQLIATGNFQTVDGKSRTRFFMVDLGTGAATLNPWYYDAFAKPCTSTHPRRIAYLQGVDYAPNGSYFVVTATGQIPKSGDVGVTVCDGAARFEVANDTKPTWINYTGGDSVWSAAATGSAVYVQGHFQWLDNPNGYASQCPTGETCASRRGVGAINPVSGKALSWNANKPAQIGGKDFLATTDGLWIGSDSIRIHGEPHRGIGLMPLQ